MLIAIIAAHGMFAAWILLGDAVPPVKPANDALIMVDFSIDDIEHDSPAKPAEVSPVPDTPPARLASESKMVTPPLSFGSGNGEGCSVAKAIEAALISDREAMKELAGLPAGVRSEADAVMLWNGAWLDAAPETQSLMGDRGIPELKRVVTAAVEALPADCAQAETVGPQLIPILEPQRTTMVVIGSGVWRWAALVEPQGKTEVRPRVQPVTDWLTSWLASGN